MRSVPTDLLNKIFNKLQTPDANADPRIYLIFQRTARYIEEKALLDPMTVAREDEEVFGSWDLAVRRPPERNKTYPDYIYRVQVVDGNCYITRADYDRMIEALTDPEREEEDFMHFYWEPLWDFSGVVEVAIEFDGYWMRTERDAEICFDSPANWNHVTEEIPWVFWTDSAGVLRARRGPDGMVYELATGVSKISAIRSWKNVYRWNHDHGLVVGYIRNNTVYYRSWANQGTEENPQPPAWEIEREVTELPTPAQDVAVFRTNDYRTGFLCESEGEIHWAITDRNWAGMAIPPHTIYSRGTEVLADLIAVEYIDGKHEHTITLTGNLPSTHLYEPMIDSLQPIYLLWAMPDNWFKSAENNGNTIIKAVTKYFLRDMDNAEFEVRDRNNVLFAITNVVYSDNPWELIFTVSDLNYSSEGDLTLKYLGGGATKGEAGQTVDPFDITFTPTGLEYVVANAPEVEAIWNE